MRNKKRKIKEERIMKPEIKQGNKSRNEMNIEAKEN
jgi:hypothetical protein